jgi:hypothetical protein
MSLPRPEKLFQQSPVGPSNAPSGLRPSGRRPQQQHGENKAAALRRIERKRRLVQRAFPDGFLLPSELLGRITYGSFRLEALSITERDVSEALSCGAGRRAFRPPQLLRIRNHVAILRHIQKSIRHGQELKLPVVVRWYTSFSCGLSMGVDLARIGRLEQYLCRINSPQLRLQQAIADVAQVYVQLTSDPIFPGFNGILARLLLQSHLARCRLPMVTFDAIDERVGPAASSFELTLLEMISDAYDVLTLSRSR